MKKLIVFLAIFSALGLLLYHAPRLLDLRLVRAQVAARLSSETGWEIDAATLRWDWFPAPHFSLDDITMNRGGISLFVPETRIFPRWSSLLDQELDLGELSLMNPEISVRSWDEVQGSESPPLPRINITIKNGTALVTAGPFAEGTPNSPLVLSSINSRLRLAPELGEIKFDCTSSIFSDLTVAGKFNPVKKSYQMDYQISGLNLGNLLPTLFNGRMEAKVTGVSLQGELKGQGLERFRLDSRGDFPCFITPDSPEKLFLDCGEFSLSINRSPQDLTIAINKLQLKNPGATLSGKIAALKNIPSPESDRENHADEETWLVDLQGEDLDLSSIREKILLLWGDQHIARTVTEIVLGGSASRASYFFRGSLSDFSKLEKMTIKVDVEQAAIHPPFTKLYLEEASGPIVISDGYLSGHDLQARLGVSRGSNCTLFLDLLNRRNEFKLDLDIEAELADLPKVLIDEVHHLKFQNEVRRFSEFEGRARGHLNIGEHLHDLAVRVRVDSLEAHGRYNRLPWPFTISKGSINVQPTEVSWQGIKGTLGPNLIHDSEGAVDWSERVRVNLANLSASLDLDPVIRELSSTTVLPSDLEKAVTRAEGPLELKKAEFSGSLSSPENWRYSLYISTKGSRWTSPLLPQPFLVENASAIIGQDRIDLVEGKLWFIEQPLLIEGSFLHKQLKNWQGKATFSGTIRDKLATWVHDKGWIPEEYFPRVPCTLDKLRIEWDRNNTSVNGTVKGGMGSPGAPEVRLDMTNTPERFSIRELVISSPKERGKLTLEYPKADKSKTSFSWQGFLDTATVGKMLDGKVFPASRLEGDFSLQLPLKPGARNFRGWIKAKGLKWSLGDSPGHIFLRNFNLRSQEDGSLIIEDALIDSDDSLNLNLQGSINPSGQQLEFDLTVTADKLTGATVEGLSQGLEKITSDQNQRPAPESSPESNLETWPRNGTLQFKIDRYESAAPAKVPVDETRKAQAGNFIVSPAKGFITYLPEGGQTLDLRSSKVCGIDISGTIYSDGATGRNKLNFFTDSASPPLLQKVLPCLGFNNTLIEGPLNLDGNLQGLAKNWESGKVAIFSSKGYIRRLGFLAKVFSVVNLTDIFSDQKLPQLGEDGFFFNSLDLTSHIENNRLIIDKAVVKGQGLNLFGQGTIDLGTNQANLIIMVAPLKTIDAIITNLPIIGQVAGGKDKAVISIPVGLKGNLRDPSVKLLPPEALGEGIVNLITNTLKMPLAIFTPLANVGK